MRSTEDAMEQIALLERETSDAENYNSGQEFGEACGWLDALKWMLEIE